LESLYENVHGAVQHVGKTPRRSGQDVQRQQELIRLRQELRMAVAKEAYEQAAKLRDLIHQREGD
jgi:protein arginine kinase activator